MHLNDKVALVFGGTAGIGLAAARAFAAEGARVVIVGRDRARGEAALAELGAGGAECAFEPGDVASAEDVERAVARTVERFGRLDCALNNAATREGFMKRVADFDDGDWDRAMAANLRGVWLCMRAEIRQMQRQEPRGGALVCTSSVNGLGAAPMGGLYSAAKAGVLALVKAAAMDYATDGIRVNALVAGAFDTDMLNDVMDQIAKTGPTIDQVRASYTSRIPLGRIGSPDEAAAAAVWLCSPAASYVTGHSMIVDGGATCFAR